ncbi:MAG: hypothetical protein HN704_03150 [Bacteroidetes bacterium]|jgi:hypothetical protein|nr:hypothetical protein [Bacteroidota bacterium]MBT6686993.1 hypothetical protein [Bacteroidota bacterium]MBT7142405.1 hypothetical protein [Bacteroidota bacterium]MBT7490586.1 hypothetical protein [Bacteroidota bacterium]
MKKVISIVFFTLLITTISFSQNGSDALRYSQSFPQGTARLSSMGGAFGALGADFSAILINPAGLGVYRKSEFVLTPSISYNKTLSNLNNHAYEDFKYDFGLNNIGLVGTFKTGNKNGWISTSIAFGYNRIRNFDFNTLVKTDEATSSMLDEFVYNANNGDIRNFYEKMAINTGAIYFDSLSNIYTNDFIKYNNSEYGHLQRRSINTSGKMGEYVAAIATNFDNKVFIGASIGFQKVNYSSTSIHEEEDTRDEIEYTNRFIYEDNLKTEGIGINFKLGAIVKPVQWIRIGGAIHSPTFFDLKEDFNSTMDFFMDNEIDQFRDIASGGYDYELTTPLKAIGSLGFVIYKSAIVSFEYEFIDYSTMRLRNGGDGYDFYNENEEIQGKYVSTGNLKSGAELKFGPLSLRAGYSLYGSPYNSDALNKDAFTTAYSGGFGINSKSFYFDFAYVYSQQSIEYVLYQYSDPVVSTIEKNPNQLMATLGFRF